MIPPGPPAGSSHALWKPPVRRGTVTLAAPPPLAPAPPTAAPPDRAADSTDALAAGGRPSGLEVARADLKLTSDGWASAAPFTSAARASGSSKSRHPSSSAAPFAPTAQSLPSSTKQAWDQSGVRRSASWPTEHPFSVRAAREALVHALKVDARLGEADPSATAAAAGAMSGFLHPFWAELLSPLGALTSASALADKMVHERPPPALEHQQYALLPPSTTGQSTSGWTSSASAEEIQASPDANESDGRPEGLDAYVRALLPSAPKTVPLLIAHASSRSLRRPTCTSRAT